jgi:hypothetical protein
MEDEIKCAIPLYFSFIVSVYYMPNIYHRIDVELKGQCHEIFCFWFFS